MTPLRAKEMLMADILGLREIVEMMPDDPIAGPLMQSRIVSLEEEMRRIEEKPQITPETELFFGPGPALGSMGLDAKFASRVLNSFQDIVSNQFAAVHHGALRRTGRRRGENDSRLYLTALPRGSFGLQLSQPQPEDFVSAEQVAKVMEDVTDLVAAAAEDDSAFETTLQRFHPRVLTPLRAFLDTLNNAKSDCQMISGMKRAVLTKEKVESAFARVSAAQTDSGELDLQGIFDGVLLQSGKFEFEPQGQSLISGWIAEDVTEEQAEAWGALTGKPSKAKVQVTTVTTPNGQKRLAYELLELEPASAPLGGRPPLN